MKKLLVSGLAALSAVSIAAPAFAYPYMRYDVAYGIQGRPHRRDVREKDYGITVRDRDILKEITNNARTAQVAAPDRRGYSKLARARMARNTRRMNRQPKPGYDRYRTLFYNETDIRDGIVNMQGVPSHETVALTYDRPTRRDIEKYAELDNRPAVRRTSIQKWQSND